MTRSRLRSLAPLSLTAFLAIAAAGCGSDSTPAAPSPTPVTTTETFAGTVPQLGATDHSFVVSTTGPVTVTLTSVSPLSTMAMGVKIGAWDGTTCGTAIAANPNARAGTTALSGTGVAGNYCVSVYDSGNIPEGWTVGYSVDVSHP